MGQALVLDESVLARRVDGLFVETPRVQFPLLQTRELGANQCRPVCERCRTVVCPDRYLLEMRCQRFQMLGPLFGRGHIATHRSCKRRVEMVLSNLELRWRRPNPRFSFRCRRHRGRVVGEISARWQLGNPIPRRGKGPLAFALEALLEAALR